jgi:hypothetical protein
MIPRWRRLRRALKLADQVVATAGTEQATAQYAYEFSNADFEMRRDALCLLASQAFKGNLQLPRVGDVMAKWDSLPAPQTGPVVRARRLQHQHRDPLPVDKAKAVPIEVVVERLGLPMKRQGRTVRALCPFHDDTDPSMNLDLRKGLWHCKVCWVGGDGIELWMKQRGLSFAEAVREVAA